MAVLRKDKKVDIINTALILVFLVFLLFVEKRVGRGSMLITVLQKPARMLWRRFP